MVLGALLEADPGLRAGIAEAPRRLASTLTFLEAHRGIIRAALARRLDRHARRWATNAVTSLEMLTSSLVLDDRVLRRARQVFPREPVRSLDALHLASALVWREAVGDLTVAATDERIRDNARALGFDVFPK